MNPSAPDPGSPGAPRHAGDRVPPTNEMPVTRAFGDDAPDYLLVPWDPCGHTRLGLASVDFSYESRRGASS